MSSDEKRNLSKRLFELCLSARFKHPPITVIEGSFDSLVKMIASDLEESCFLGTGNRGEDVYITYVTRLMVHIAPYYYAARHSFYFRTLLARGNIRDNKGEINEFMNVALTKRNVLFPEIYANHYFRPDERSFVHNMVEAELGSGSRRVSLYLEGKLKLSEGDMIYMNKTSVCFANSNECWNQVQPQINTPCDTNDGTCDLHSARYCTHYEKFLLHFAEFNMAGDVRDLSDEERNLSERTTILVRRVWSQEIKMARVYLDILEAEE
jgi:hypothetical protein